MTAVDETRTVPDGFWVPSDQNGQPMRPELRRLRGLRFPVIPTGSWLAQVGGAVAATVGCYMQFGAAITLIVVGVGVAVLGSLREAGKV